MPGRTRWTSSAITTSLKSSSTRRSATKPQPEYVFFTDRDLGRYVFPDRLEAAGLRIERHDTHFLKERTPDAVWMPFVAEKGWIALSRNRHQQGVPFERGIVMRSGLALFHLIGPKATHQDLAENFVRTLPRILDFCEANDRPFIARIYRPSPGLVVATPGHVQLALSYDTWKANSERK